MAETRRKRGRNEAAQGQAKSPAHTSQKRARMAKNEDETAGIWARIAR